MAKHISFLVIALVLNFFNTSLAIPEPNQTARQTQPSHFLVHGLQLAARQDQQRYMCRQEGTWFRRYIFVVPARIMPSRFVSMAPFWLLPIKMYPGVLETGSYSRVSIDGGILDGQGTGLWACKASSKLCPSGATTLDFDNSNNIVISGLTSLNSQMFHIVINGCRNVKMQGVKVLASGTSPNTDGIHVQLSSGVAILRSKISTGDDCVSIGPGTANLWIENVVCCPGHGIR
ncbi:hypothetical protein RJ639_032934 [Escallonia herrerae]|uniref:Polygalacturonase n=1 Tax=Escallonia herrerae TaxID=1293975 RepID=A0AA88WWB3_9ASTE|nr:hypothetical protein RJ639_032934 [Escallonia herrerae]